MDGLIKHSATINKLLARYGVKFGIYKNGEFKEQLFPFDPIPRVIEHEEFLYLEKGLKQRVNALNCFLRDIYGKKQIVKDGVIPEEFIFSAKGFLPPCDGVSPPKGIFSHISGIDLVQSKDDSWYILEDNLRVPSGASYPMIARDFQRRSAPESFLHNSVIDNRNYAQMLKNVMDHVNTGGINVILSPGRYNAAFFEHSYLAERTGAVLTTGKDIVCENDKLYYIDYEGKKRRIGAVYRRISDEYLDPMTFYEESVIGIPHIQVNPPYGKSYSNNYLEQKRINNHDKSSYICVEGDFPPIVTPEEWYRAQEIKAGRVKESFSAKKGKKTTHCVQENRDLWGSRLRCTCGCGFRKNVWHKYDDKPNTYGYQCYNILNNGSANQRRKAGADDTGYCDQPMIADWKLELMGKKILELVFRDKRDLIDHTCDMIRKCLQTARPQGVTLSNIVGKMERIKFKKEMLLEMRTDGEITKQEFLDQRKKLDKELQELQTEYDSKSCSPAIEMDQPEWGKIQTALGEILDLSQPTPSPDLIRKFVAQIVPESKTNFQWHLNLDGNQTTHVGMTVEGRKNKAVVSFAAEGPCSPLAFGAVIEYPTLCRAATDKNAYLSAMQDRPLSRMAGIKELPEVCKPNRDLRGCKSVYVQLEQ